MTGINIDFVTSAGVAIAGLDQYQMGIMRAKNRIALDGDGLIAALRPAAAQLDRFVAANIQVDTGRTKNSIFQASGRESSNSVFVGLFSNVSYSLYVGHIPKKASRQFFRYAAEVEGPKAMNNAANALAYQIEEGFA